MFGARESSASKPTKRLRAAWTDDYRISHLWPPLGGSTQRLFQYGTVSGRGAHTHRRIPGTKNSTTYSNQTIIDRCRLAPWFLEVRPATEMRCCQAEKREYI